MHFKDETDREIYSDLRENVSIQLIIDRYIVRGLPEGEARGRVQNVIGKIRRNDRRPLWAAALVGFSTVIALSFIPTEFLSDYLIKRKVLIQSVVTLLSGYFGVLLLISFKTNDNKGVMSLLDRHFSRDSVRPKQTFLSYVKEYFTKLFKLSSFLAIGIIITILYYNLQQNSTEDARINEYNQLEKSRSSQAQRILIAMELTHNYDLLSKGIISADQYADALHSALKKSKDNGFDDITYQIEYLIREFNQGKTIKPMR